MPVLVASSSPALVTVLPVSMVRIWPVATLASMVPPISLSSVRSLLPLPMLPSPEMTLLTLSRVWPAVVAMIWLPAPSETAPSAVEPARVSVPEAASTSSVSPEPASRMPLVPAFGVPPFQSISLPVMSSSLPPLASISPELLTVS